MRNSVKLMMSGFVLLCASNILATEQTQWVHNHFTGCVEEKDQSQKCKNMCGTTYKRIGGHGTQNNAKLCSDKDKPIACECDFVKEENKG